jgi:hypothetical protein
VEGQVNYAKLLEMNSFFTLHSFSEVAKHRICQVNFGKLLEMLQAALFFFFVCDGLLAF